MIFNIAVVLMFLALIFLVLKLVKNSHAKVNKLIPRVKISAHEAKALEELVSESAIQDALIKLNDRERIILKLDGVQLLEFKNIKNKGMYQGISLRVMDGLSYRIGEFSHKQKKALTNVDIGELIFTSDRLIFLGDRESLEISLKKLLSVNIAGEMLEIHQTGRSKVVLFDGLKEAWKNYIALFDSHGIFQAESGVLRIAFIAKELLK